MSEKITVRILAKSEDTINRIEDIVGELEYAELEVSLLTEKINKKHLSSLDCDLLVVDVKLIDLATSQSAIMDIFKDEEHNYIPYVIYLSDRNLLADIERLNVPYIADNFSKEKIQNILLHNVFYKKIVECHIKNLKLESLSIFTGGAAHDFNNIMGTIMGYSELLKFKTKDSPEIVKYIEFIFNSCIKAQQLIELLTHLSRNWEQRKIFKIQAHIILKETIRTLQNRYHIEKTIFEDIIKENDIIEIDPSNFYALCSILVKNMLELNNSKEPIKIALNTVEYFQDNKHNECEKIECLELKILSTAEKNVIVAKMAQHKDQIEKILHDVNGYFEYIDEVDTKESGIRVLIPKTN